MKKIFLFLIAATTIVSCSQPAGPDASFNLDSVKASINIANTVYMKLMIKNDSTAIGNLYTKDGCLLFNGMPKICGRDAITSFMGGAKKMGIASLKITAAEILGSKDMVSEEGTFEIIGLAGTVIDKGKYIVLWKMEEGKWKIYRDITNSDGAIVSK